MLSWSQIVVTSNGRILYTPEPGAVTAADKEGRTQWECRFPADFGQVTGLCEDADGGAYAFGMGGSLTRLNNAGKVIWSKHIGGPCQCDCCSDHPSHRDQPVGVPFLLKGDVVCLLHGMDDHMMGPHLFQAEGFDPMGNRLWECSGEENWIKLYEQYGWAGLRGAPAVVSGDQLIAVNTLGSIFTIDSAGNRRIYEHTDYELFNSLALGPDGAVCALLKADSEDLPACGKDLAIFGPNEAEAVRVDLPGTFYHLAAGKDMIVAGGNSILTAVVNGSIAWTIKDEGRYWHPVVLAVGSTVVVRNELHYSGAPFDVARMDRELLLIDHTGKVTERTNLPGRRCHHFVVDPEGRALTLDKRGRLEIFTAAGPLR